MAGRREKEALYDGFALVAKALSSGRRAEIVDLLAQGARSVEEIAEAIAQSVANTSHHLRTLARAGLLASDRDGQRVIYRLASDRVAELWGAMREVATAHVAQVEGLARAYLGDRPEPIGRDELRRRMRSGAILVVDVRPREEYRAGHIRGARSLPLDDLSRRLRSLPKDREIVAYCRGPYCVFADDAVRVLRSKGYRARRLEDGFPEWRRAGLPVGAGGDG